MRGWVSGSWLVAGLLWRACSPQEASFHTGAAVARGTWVEPVGGFGLLVSSMAGDSNGCFQVVARANDRMYLRP